MMPSQCVARSQLVPAAQHLSGYGQVIAVLCMQVRMHKASHCQIHQTQQLGH
jgi:hypothetical protein